MKDKMYACNNEFEGGCVGTLEDIKEIIVENGWDLGHCEFFEISKPVKIKFEVDDGQS